MAVITEFYKLKKDGHLLGTDSFYAVVQSRAIRMEDREDRIELIGSNLQLKNLGKAEILRENYFTHEGTIFGVNYSEQTPQISIIKTLGKESSGTISLIEEMLGEKIERI